MSLPVSIIIPARNAAETLTSTLESLVAQTSADWEAIVIENGSTDATLAVAQEFAQRDSRVRVESDEPRGVSAARNRGLQFARHEWILFLDADDWIKPQHLQRLTSVLADDPRLDAIHCGWQRVTSDGDLISEAVGPTTTDLFSTLTLTCTFAIHACIARRTMILEVGGFDPGLRTCEDWDLWLRLARAGAKFGQVPDMLACYRARPNSASMDGRQMLADSFLVLSRACAPDPRVGRPLPAYADGAPAAQLPSARLSSLLWQAGLALGSGEDAVPLIAAIANDPPVDAEPYECADTLFDAMLLPNAQSPRAAAALRARIAPQLVRFLNALEKHTRQRGLAGGAQLHLDRRILTTLTSNAPVTIGRIHACTVEVTTPFADVVVDNSVERVRCRVEMEGETLGDLELPVYDGAVPADILLDAVAAEFAWPILGRFFEHTVYPKLTVQREPAGWTVLHGTTALASGLPGETAISWRDAHDAIGWPVFIQQAWALDALPDDTFYVIADAERRDLCSIASIEPEVVVLELSDVWSDQQLNQAEVDVVLTAGGAMVVRTPLRVPNHQLSAQTARTAVTIDSSLELCRVCVREALLQRSLRDPLSLRDRLAIAASRLQTSNVLSRAAIQPAPEAFSSAALSPGSDVAICPRRPFAPCGTSGSRRAALPRAIFPELQRLAAAGRERIILPDSTSHPPRRVLYAPELVYPTGTPNRRAPQATLSHFGGVSSDFEHLFSSREDPWSYSSPYEQTKYEQTLALLPRKRFRHALELACAEGHFTVQLAPRVEHLIAADISATALRRARERCRNQPSIEFRQLDLINQPLPAGRFDLLVCSEVLYYVGTVSTLREIAEKFVHALEPDGHLVTAHAHLQSDDPDQPGFDWPVPFGARTIGEVLSTTPGLELAEELRTPCYRVQLYRRARLRRWLPRRSPQLRTGPHGTPLSPDVAAHFRSRPRAPRTEPQTTSLPILMYHRIANDGPTALALYRLSPSEFEKQLEYLQDNDYRTATFEEWRIARESKRPLPGRRVMLTFDDGSVDFITTAFPLLRRYHFDAVVYLPTNEVGGRCSWDARYGTPAPVLGWPEIRALQREGVMFGSHTVSHAMLTTLSPTGIAREALRSRAELEEQLGGPITSIAYPYGDHDSVVQSIAGACGYVYGVTCEGRRCTWNDPLLALPRLNAAGIDLSTFARLLEQ